MAALNIPENEVDFPLKADKDRSGRVFWWKGEIYRAIPDDRKEFCERLFRDGIIEKLVQKGLLIETERMQFQMDGYPLILKHRTLPFVSYGQEWCALMLRDAAIKTIDILIELAHYDLTLQDAHTRNILIDGTNPIQVDFGSIVPAHGDRHWAAYQQFRQCFLYPLHLEVEGYGKLARWLMQSSEYLSLQAELSALTQKHSFSSRHRLMRQRLFQVAQQRTPAGLRPLALKALTLARALTSGSRPKSHRSRLDTAVHLRREVESIRIPLPKTEWSEYLKDFPPLSPSPEWSSKRHNVYKVLSDLKPATVLEIGSNRGWYSQLAASLGCQVVSFDVDETAVTQLYMDAKATKQKILPLLMDFKFFTPARGYFCRTHPSADERLRCDLVLAIAITHHLVFKQFLRFETIAKGLALFTRRWLLVEFKPHENKHVRNWWTEEYSWYTLENFVQALKKSFNTVRTVHTESDSSILLLCEK